MALRDQLLAVAAAYEAGTGLSEATISKRLFGNSAKLAALRQSDKPGDVWTTTHEAALRLMSSTWPDGSVWPASVERPA